MEFSTDEQKLIKSINEDKDYVNYLARLYYKMGDFEEVAAYLNVEDDFFLRFFSINPDIEFAFDEEVSKISEKVAKRTNNLALPKGLQIVAEIMTDEHLKDKRILLQAAALHLQFYLKRKEMLKGSADDDLDKLFRKVQEEQDEKRE